MQAIFFDWNGTLLDDTLTIWYEVIRKTFCDFGKEPPTIAEHIQKMSGGDYSLSYRSRGITASREVLAAIYEAYYQQMLEDMLSKGDTEHVLLYPGVSKTLTSLRKNNIVTGIVTTQPQLLVEPLLEKLNITSLLTRFVSNVINKAEAINSLVAAEKIPLTECYYVGDSPSDIIHAKKAGVIAVAFVDKRGYIPIDMIKATDPDYIIHDIREILQLI